MSTSIEIPDGIYRLAKQLGRDPEELASDVMRAGIEALDDGIANEPIEIFNPVCFIAQVVGYTHDHEFTISGWIERMSPEVLASCENEAAECDQKLQEIVRERILRGAELWRLAQPNLQEIISGHLTREKGDAA